MSAITVRPADLHDVPWLLRQLKQFAVFDGSKHSLFPDEDEAETMLKSMIGEHPFFVAENGQRVGFIAGYLHRHPWNSRVIQLTETFWWVDEQHRGSRAGLLLLEHFIACGKEHADRIAFALESKSPVNPKTLEKRGFRLQESNYIKEMA